MMKHIIVKPIANPVMKKRAKFAKKLLGMSMTAGLVLLIGSAGALDCGSVPAGQAFAQAAGDGGIASAGKFGSASAGDYGVSASRGSSSAGENGGAAARGKHAKVRGGIGSVLVVCVEKEDSYDIAEWKAAVVDGERIRPDTWYTVENGEFKEAD